MSRATRRWSHSSWGSAAALQVYGPPPDRPSPAPAQQAAAGGDEDGDKPFEPWDDVLKDTRAIPGYFTFHLKRDNLSESEARIDRALEASVTVHPR